MLRIQQLQQHEPDKENHTPIKGGTAGKASHPPRSVLAFKGSAILTAKKPTLTNQNAPGTIQRKPLQSTINTTFAKEKVPGTLRKPGLVDITNQTPLSKRAVDTHTNTTAAAATAKKVTTGLKPAAAPGSSRLQDLKTTPVNNPGSLATRRAQQQSQQQQQPRSISSGSGGGLGSAKARSTVGGSKSITTGGIQHSNANSTRGLPQSRNELMMLHGNDAAIGVTGSVQQQMRMSDFNFMDGLEIEYAPPTPVVPLPFLDDAEIDEDNRLVEYFANLKKPSMIDFADFKGRQEMREYLEAARREIAQGVKPFEYDHDAIHTFEKEDDRNSLPGLDLSEDDTQSLLLV